MSGRLFVLMGDLVGSKQLRQDVEGIGASYFRSIEWPFYQEMMRICQTVDVQIVNLVDDHFQMLVSGFEHVHRLGVEIYAVCRDLEARLTSSESGQVPLFEQRLRVVPKLGAVELPSSDEWDISRRIDFCTRLVVSSPPAANTGSFLVCADYQSLPDHVRRVAKPHYAPPDLPAVLRIPVQPT